MTDNQNFNLNKICSLAKLKVPTAEHPKLEKEMLEILALADKVQNPQIAELSPLFHPCDLVQSLRPDIALETPKDQYRDRLLANAPAADAANFLVPKVIE